MPEGLATPLYKKQRRPTNSQSHQTGVYGNSLSTGAHNSMHHTPAPGLSYGTACPAPAFNERADQKRTHRGAYARPTPSTPMQRLRFRHQAHTVLESPPHMPPAAQSLCARRPLNDVCSRLTVEHMEPTQNHCSPQQQKRHNVDMQQSEKRREKKKMKRIRIRVTEGGKAVHIIEAQHQPSRKRPNWRLHNIGPQGTERL